MRNGISSLRALGGKKNKNEKGGSRTCELDVKCQGTRYVPGQE